MMAETDNMAPERSRQQPTGTAENVQQRNRDPELDELLKLIEIFTPRMAHAQQREFEKLCEKYRIPCTWAGQGAAIDDEWLGKPWTTLKAWYRRNMGKKPLEFVRGIVKKDDNCSTIFQNDDVYAAGFASRYPPLLNEEAINQIIAHLKPITNDFEKCSWPQWFEDFEGEMKLKNVPVVQWTNMLKTLAKTGVKEVVANTLRKLEDAGVPKVMYYGIVRDKLLDFAGDRYRPETYLSQMHEIKPGSMKAGPLATTLTRLAMEYEQARERAALKRHKFPPLTLWYLAWLYSSKLDPAISGKLPRLADVPARTRGNLFDVVRLKTERAEREVDRSNAAAFL